MVRSGLQHDVIKMYRQGVKIAMSKSPEARPNFMLHLRYHFRNPPLRQRDYTAIEHQASLPYRGKASLPPACALYKQSSVSGTLFP
ncbi:hypothetical protein IAT40_000248 [Kwoniella sp. CBS 6097]